MLSMHSIRETAGTKDVGLLIVSAIVLSLKSQGLIDSFSQDLFEVFFEKFGDVDNLQHD